MESFSQSIISFLHSVPTVWQLVVLGSFSFAEGLPIIGSLLPGGTIAVFAGGLSADGTLSAFSACMLVGGASFLGDMTGFFLGKRFRHLPWIQRLVTHEKHQKSWDVFDRHVAVITIFGKLLPVVRSTPSLFAAIRGVRTRRYIVYSCIGSFLWGFVGVYAGNLLTTYLGDRAVSLLFILITCSIVGALIHQLYKKHKKS